MRAAYDAIADEYYDPNLHKTSRNFDQTTFAALTASDFRNLIPSEGLVLDVGAGRGRVREFLGIAPSRTVQVDDSARMLSLQPREESLLRIRHRGEELPFLDDQFSCVAAFLCDAFMGLDFLQEAYRVLAAGGALIGTIPAYEWGAALRPQLEIDLSSTRFLTRSGATVIVPSTLVRLGQLSAMLRLVGFKADRLRVESHRLPPKTAPISKDIELAAKRLGTSVLELPIIYTFIGTK